MRKDGELNFTGQGQPYHPSERIVNNRLIDIPLNVFS